jgi:hypothetical protein
MSNEGKYSVKVTSPNYHGKHPCKLQELTMNEVSLLLSYPMSTLNKLQAGYGNRVEKLMNGDHLGDELRDGMVLFLHIPTQERMRVDELLWDEGMKMHRSLYPNWEKTNEFRSFTARLTSIKEERSRPKQITLDEIISSGKICKQTDSPIADEEAKGLLQESFYIVRLTLYRKYWPWKWMAQRLLDINSNWWYWTHGVIFITQNY